MGLSFRPRRPLTRLAAGAASAHLDPDPADAVAVRRAVAALPRRQRTAVVLRYYADLPVAEVPVLMGCAPGTVKSLTRKALTALRQRKHEDIEQEDVLEIADEADTPEASLDRSNTSAILRACVAKLSPAKWYFRKHEDQPTTEVAIQRSFAQDLYLVMAGYDLKGLADCERIEGQVPFEHFAVAAALSRIAG